MREAHVSLTVIEHHVRIHRKNKQEDIALVCYENVRRLCTLHKVHTSRAYFIKFNFYKINNNIPASSVVGERFLLCRLS